MKSRGVDLVSTIRPARPHPGDMWCDLCHAWVPALLHRPKTTDAGRARLDNTEETL